MHVSGSQCGCQHCRQLLAGMFTWVLPYNIVAGFQGQESLEREPAEVVLPFYDLASVLQQFRGKEYRPDLSFAHCGKSMWDGIYWYGHHQKIQSATTYHVIQISYIHFEMQTNILGITQNEDSMDVFVSLTFYWRARIQMYTFTTARIKCKNNSL